jgi:hypothetical protein
MLDHDACLHDNFVGGAWPAAEFFLGAAESPPRLDDRDFLWGWHAMAVLGKYNAKTGGDMFLWDEKKVIKMPIGSTFLFPAAFMQYSFTRVQPGEHQYYFAQYAHAGLFRFVESGFRSEAEFEDTAWQAEREAWRKIRDAHMTTAVVMHSRVDDFVL